MAAGFQIPNVPDAFAGDQAEPDSGDMQMLGDQRFGCISGGDCTAHGSPDFGVSMAAGVWLVNGEVVSASANANLAVTSPGANGRFDLVVVNGAGVYQRIQGDSSTTNPRFPSWDKTTTICFAIWIPVGATGITQSMITDKRVMVSPSFKRRSGSTTDVLIDLGVNSSLFRTTADGSLTWEAGTNDLSLAKLDANTLNLVGSLIAQAVNTANATLTLKAITSQTAHVLDIKNAAGTTVAFIDAAGNATFGNIGLSGNGDPNGVVTANIGSLYQQLDADSTALRSHLWVKESGNGTSSGWIALPEYNTGSTNIATGLMMAWPSGNTTIPAGFLLCDGSAVSRATYSALFSIIGVEWGTGDGSTTFNLPDFRWGRVPAGYSASDTEFNLVGKTGGEKSHVLSISELAAHTHPDTHDHGAFTSGNGGSHTHSVTDGGHYHWIGGSPDPRVSGIAVGWTGTTDGGTYWAPVQGSAGKPGGFLQINNEYFSGLYTQTQSTGISLVAAADHSHTVDVPAYNGTSGSQGSGSGHNNIPPYGVVKWVIKS